MRIEKGFIIYSIKVEAFYCGQPLGDIERWEKTLDDVVVYNSYQNALELACGILHTLYPEDTFQIFEVELTRETTMFIEKTTTVTPEDLSKYEAYMNELRVKNIHRRILEGIGVK